MGLGVEVKSLAKKPPLWGLKQGESAQGGLECSLRTRGKTRLHEGQRSQKKKLEGAINSLEEKRKRI